MNILIKYIKAKNRKYFRCEAFFLMLNMKIIAQPNPINILIGIVNNLDNSDSPKLIPINKTE